MSSAVMAVIDVDATALLEPKPFRDALETSLRAGLRPVTFFGRKSPEGVVLTAVLQDVNGGLHVSRARVDPERGFHALTADFPAMHCFERELHEQHDVRIGGHPWLKPVRFSGSGPAGRDAYAFYEIDGKEVHEVAVGPVHAGVIEPGAFRFMCLGEQVHHLEIHLGYQHRGVEAMLLRGDPRRLAPLVETIAGDSSIAHGWAYCAAIEALAGVDVGAAIEGPRAVMLELERIAMHLAGLSGLAADVGFLQGASTYGRLRTTAINTSMRLCGSRFGRGMMRPGGLGARLEASEGLRPSDSGALTLADLRKNLALLQNDIAIIDECFLDARTVQHRMQGVGKVDRERALQLGLVGMAARASGVSLDQRTVAKGIYANEPIEMVVEPTGDCWARARIRILEIGRSLRFVRHVIDRHPSWKPARRVLGPLAPNKLAIAMVEGWRGEVVHCLETDGDGALVHYKVQDPSLRNWLGLAMAVRENEISDFPICNKSFDLSYCGHDL
jgi:Ni,Fe-hydrogenase III large subunit